MGAGGDSIVIELGWPAKELWPNGSYGNRYAIARARKAAREEAFWATKYVKPLSWKHGGQPIAIHIIGHTKTANAVDAQNLIIGLKAHFDGIADALGVNDKHFAAPTVSFAEPVKGGRVEIEVRI
jgi:hypothetical protein